jgi:signal transduction protein with GAF and PtsI domain
MLSPIPLLVQTFPTTETYAQAKAVRQIVQLKFARFSVFAINFLRSRFSDFQRLSCCLPTRLTQAFDRYRP